MQTKQDHNFDVTIEPGGGEKNYWPDLWRYRELFCFLAWRDILVRYKQTAIGIAWSLLRPLLTMLIFTLVFGVLAKLPSSQAPYPVMVFAAMLPWQFFANSFSEAGNSLINNANLISKVYFPRLIVPAGAIVTAMVDFLISLAVLALIMFYYGFTPPLRCLLLPLFFLPVLGASLGAGLLVAAVNVKYRDFRHVIPFIVQAGLYISPVGFDSSIVPEKWRLLYSMNPMVGVIDGFRWALLGGEYGIYLPGFILSLALIGVLLVLGIKYFRHTEKRFADVI